jgi:hypothetical protein
MITLFAVAGIGFSVLIGVFSFAFLAALLVGMSA